jgi:LuxR family transcriptional regulator, maltose regulon positive regulatory protein
VGEQRAVVWNRHQLKRLGYERDLWRVVASAWAEQSRLALLQKDLPAADRYLHMAEANGPYSTLWDESSATLRARLLTAHGQPADALALLDAELASLDTETCRRQALKLRVVRATVLKAASRSTEALRVLAECVEEACPGSYVRLMVDEGPTLATLLRELLARQTADPESRAFIGALLEQLDDDHRAATPESDEPHEKLSGRELEVLGQMADGLSNQAIASALVVSLPTVKSHVRSILVKLAAKNRTEAVAKARQRNLLLR